MYVAVNSKFRVNEFCYCCYLSIAVGGKFPADKLKDEEVTAYRDLERQKMNRGLNEYLLFCAQLGVIFLLPLFFLQIKLVLLKALEETIPCIIRSPKFKMLDIFDIELINCL